MSGHSGQILIGPKIGKGIISRSLVDLPPVGYGRTGRLRPHIYVKGYFVKMRPFLLLLVFVRLYGTIKLFGGQRMKHIGSIRLYLWIS